MFVKIFRSILNSTVWMQEDHVLRVWFTMLLLADMDGVVHCSIPGIAKEARVSIEDCLDAVQVLESEDKYSQSSENNGRRIERVSEEAPIWHIVNYKKYRNRRSEAQRREYQREYMREYRRKKQKKEENVNDSITESSQIANTHSQRKPEVHELSQAEAEAYIKPPTEAHSSLQTKAPNGRLDTKHWISFWNSIADKTGGRRISVIRDKRLEMLGARVRQYGKEQVEEVLAQREYSAFLRGEKGRDGWVNGGGAQFDWLIRPNNFVKVMEGHFKDNQHGKSFPKIYR